jgi:4-azaleucine resistance transporter AzlC
LNSFKIFQKKELVESAKVRYDKTNKLRGRLMETPNYQTFRQGIQDCLPTVLGYLGIGIAAGVVGKGIGLEIWQIMAMSVIVYAGSAQFIMCGLIAIVAPVPSVIFTVFLVNLRHFLMSMSVAQHFKNDSLGVNIGIGSLLTDESYGVLTTALHTSSKVSASWTNGLNLTAYLTWIIATGIGGVLGSFIPNPETFGLDFALTAMFLGLFLFQADGPMKKKTRQTILILVVVVASLIVLMRITRAELAVIFSTLIGCLVGVFTDE